MSETSKASPATGGIAPDDLFAALPDCVRVLTLDGRVEQMNPAGMAAQGIETIERVRGVRWPELWPDEYRDVMEAALAEARAGRTARFKGCAITFYNERKWWETVVAPILGDDGKPHRLLAVSRDVTQTVEEKAFFNSIVELLPNPLLVKRASDGRYVLMNRAAEQIFGLDHTALGKTGFELFPEAEARFFAEEDAEVIASREVRISEEEPITIGGEVRRFTTKKLATFDGDTPMHLVVIGEDVTDRHAASIALQAALAEAEAANQAKSAFLANMSHEIRTPLNGVVGVADLLARTGLTEEQLELVNIIKACGDTLDRMLMDVLDLSKIEAGKLTISAEPFHLGDLVRSVAGLMRPNAEAKGLAFACEAGEGCNELVSGDPVRVRQIVTNLLSNAIKFTEAGEIRVRIEALGADHYRVSVRDTGIGFDEVVRARLFQRFEQADGTINRRFGGTGLGLAISRQLASLMGGDLACESTPGEGSTFSLELPLPPAARPAQPIGAEPAEEALDAGRLTVLAADDHATNRRVVQLALEAVGAEVYLANDGAEALQLFKDRAFDLVLMDMQMPQMDGPSAVRAIRAVEAERAQRPTPVVMLTANMSEAHVRTALESGADAHLAKPLKPAALLSIISQLLGDRPDDEVQESRRERRV